MVIGERILVDSSAKAKVALPAMGKIGKRELIVKVWRGLGARRVGRRELRAIQRALAKEFGDGLVQSPATIARLLADEGAELKHPEVIEFDAKWRQAQINAEETRFRKLTEVLSESPLSIEKGETLLLDLELLRVQFEKSEDRSALQRLKDLAIEARQDAQAFSKDRKVDELARREQKEIAEWLSVWLQTPDLFAQWLELRKRSPEFRKTFRR